MKILKSVLLGLIGIGLIMVTAEAQTPKEQLVWSGSWLAVMTISALTLNHLEKKEANNETKS
jgi:hypothetical protein